MTSQLEPLCSDGALRPFAPLVLAAWQDGRLTPSELLELREVLQRATWLDARRREVLAGWLDPQKPPTPGELRRLQGVMGEWLQGRSRIERRSLDRFCRALAEGDLSERDRRNALWVLSRAGQLVDPVDFERGGWLPRTVDRPRRHVYPQLPGSEWIQRVARLLDGEGASTRAKLRELLGSDDLHPVRDLDTEQYRRQVLQWLKHLMDQGVLADCYPEGLQGPRDLTRFMATFESLALFDLSLVVKFGVQAGLFAGSIELLGTEQHQPLRERALRGEVWGCFAMTERGHGSNVRGLRTQAVYLPDDREFDIHTPSASAGKEWIGNAARDGEQAVVFAQLRVGDEDHGVHAFVVPIRDAEGQPMPGVQIEDCGHKMGLNGVDNGRLWFDHVRVPRAALLDRFGHVDDGGLYASSIPSSGKRFFKMLGTLVGGRVAVGGAANSAAKVGLSVALRYAAHRTQFEDAEGTPSLLLDFPTHRLRLLPRLANVCAYTLAQNELVRLLEDPESGLPGEPVHHDPETLAAGLKAMATWNATDALQACRECCGGQGYLSANRIDAMRTDVDVFTTFEGDNTVLLSLVASNLLRLTRKQLRQRPVRGVAASIAQGAALWLKDANPVSRRRGSAEAVRSPDFLESCLRFREKSLLWSLARRVDARTRDGMPKQTAFLECQDHARACSQAYVESFVFRCIRRAAEQTPELAPLCALFGLGCVERDLGWFFDRGFVSHARASAIRSAVRACVDEVAEDALGWVEALAVPAVCLGPLADEDYLVSSGLAPNDSDSEGAEPAPSDQRSQTRQETLALAGATPEGAR